MLFNVQRESATGLLLEFGSSAMTNLVVQCKASPGMTPSRLDGLHAGSARLRSAACSTRSGPSTDGKKQVTGSQLWTKDDGRHGQLMHPSKEPIQN